ncbi:MAG: hypothetical protein HZB41_06050 [Ignavibacteriae bacterium]|nr:hypothetical protein [Ignavibacteriota bacterium]
MPPDSTDNSPTFETGPVILTFKFILTLSDCLFGAVVEAGPTKLTFDQVPGVL